MTGRGLVATALVVLLTACGEPGVTLSELESVPSSASARPTASPESSATAVASPSGGPSASAPMASSLTVDGLATVLVSDLVVRSAPGVDAETSSVLPGRLTAGDRAFVVDGPVAASGYEWYLAAPLRRPDGSQGPFGWIAAASRDGEGWLRAATPDCPTSVDLASVLALQALERLACFGGDSLTLTAPQVACGAGGGPWTWEPAWIAVLGGCGLAIDDTGAMPYRVPPGVADPGTTLPLTVRGHFDDPAAQTCRVTSADPAAYPAPSVEESVLLCRTEFVIEG